MAKTKYAYLFQASDAHGFGPKDNVRTLGCYTDHRKAINVLKQMLFECWYEDEMERHSTHVYCTHTFKDRRGETITQLDAFRIVKIRLNASDPWYEDPEPIILYKELA